MQFAILCNTKSSKYPDRIELIEDLFARGHKVYLGAIFDDTLNEYFGRSGSAEFMPIIAFRSNVNPIKEIKSLISVKKQIKKNAIEAVIIYGVKNHIAMTIGSKLGGAKKIITVVNGSGNLFEIGGIKGFFIRAMAFPLLRIAYYYSSFICFQNPDDAELFVNKRLVKRSKVFITNGSGVNLQSFQYSEMPSDEEFLFLARITPSKGIYEYIEAARIVKKKYPKVYFSVVGPVDDLVEGSCLPAIKQAEKDGVIKYHGNTDDVHYWYNKCRYFIYPSFYREGTPRCVLQAMAVGRPIVTSNSPGCKETVVNDGNGFLVPPKDSKTLADKMVYLIENPICARKMGSESRRIAEEKYDVHKINSKLIQHFNC